MFDAYFIPTLVGFIVLREAWFLYQIHILTNKIMSKNYYDYEFSKNINLSTEKVEHKVQLKDEEIDFDVRQLNELI